VKEMNFKYGVKGTRRPDKAGLDVRFPISTKFNAYVEVEE